MEKKIDDLFEYRKLPQLLSKGNYSKSSTLYRALVQLQIAIYHLDLYLEENWKTKKSELSRYWKDIYSCIKHLGISKKRGEVYLKDIQRYQKHELQLRTNKLPTEYSVEYYYYYKSCDVKLMRRIIYDYIPELKKDYSLADWRIFDLITEINDDVEDLFEDMENINGNYFLLALCQEEKSQVYTHFNDYLKSLAPRTKNRFNSKNRAQKQLKSWTLSELKQSQILLKKQVGKWNDGKKKKVLMLDRVLS